MHINPVVKKLWVAALRSGEYKQGKNGLHRLGSDGEESFCCLGVLCQIATAADVVEPFYKPDVVEYEIRLVEYDGSGGYLPYSVAHWAGVHNNGSFGFPGCMDCNLATLNDDGFTFSQIADIIDYFF